MTTDEQSTIITPDFEDTLLLLDWIYCVHCPLCNDKVVDVDKSRNQKFLDTKCPSCGKNPREEKAKEQKASAQSKSQSKREAKRERKKQKQEDKKRRGFFGR